MKAVILCGGRGTRLGEHGRSVPKALIKIGGKPIIWHLMSLYAHYGIKDFVLCLGFLGDDIREYFTENPVSDWNISAVDTGIDTNTGGRLIRAAEHLDGEQTFCVTYGDGLADVDIGELVRFHREHGKRATVTAVHPYSNFGLMDVGQDGLITGFHEKPLLKEWVNGGFFVFEQEVLSSIGENDILERAPFEELSGRGEMIAYRHTGFWKCMDTFKDNLEFEQLWKDGAVWKVW
ncbi:MAG: sugar phosphate nucleotidyltransferase [Pyrinomonadaceae bacterium]